MKWIMIGAVLGGIGVTLGAFGAHMLPDYFRDKYQETEAKVIAGQEIPAPTKYLEDFKTGVRYQMYQVLGILVVGLLARDRRSKALEIAGWLFVAATLLFSGALYVLTIGGPKFLGITWGIVAPFGGLAMIAGWIALACGACPCSQNEAIQSN